MNIKVLISEKEIQNRIKEIAKQIEKDSNNLIFYKPDILYFLQQNLLKIYHFQQLWTL